MRKLRFSNKIKWGITLKDIQGYPSLEEAKKSSCCALFQEASYSYSLSIDIVFWTPHLKDN